MQEMLTMRDVVMDVLPFTLADVEPKHVQLWAKFAAQATTQQEFWAASDVFSAFWWHTQAMDALKNAQDVLSPESSRKWLEYAADELTSAAARWAWVLELLTVGGSVPERYLRWYRDALAWRDAYTTFAEQVRSAIRLFCVAYGLSQPASMQPDGQTDVSTDALAVEI